MKDIDRIPGKSENDWFKRRETEKVLKTGGILTEEVLKIKRV